jgi:hypothetical protein
MPIKVWGKALDKECGMRDRECGMKEVNAGFVKGLVTLCLASGAIGWSLGTTFPELTSVRIPQPPTPSQTFTSKISHLNVGIPASADHNEPASLKLLVEELLRDQLAKDGKVQGQDEQKAVAHALVEQMSKTKPEATNAFENQNIQADERRLLVRLQYVSGNQSDLEIAVDDCSIEFFEKNPYNGGTTHKGSSVWADFKINVNVVLEQLREQQQKNRWEQRLTTDNRQNIVKTPQNTETATIAMQARQLERST